MKVRDQLKQNPYGSLIWRIFIGAVGGLITIIGTIFLFAPGPGILVLLAGLGILATEFAWAEVVLNRTKHHVNRAVNKVKKKKS